MSEQTQPTAFLREVFSSVQGEGINIGRRQLFVRFCDCHRNCLYCDTDCSQQAHVDVERAPGSGVFEPVPNPMSVEQLLELTCAMNRPEFAHDDLFITGGEPLLQAPFLSEFLPRARQRLGLSIHLETSGDLVQPFAHVADQIDHVLMDIKLPSVTGESETWEQHQQFMAVIKQREISATIKLVVSADTSDQDLAEAVELITATETCAQIVLQPMTAALRTDHVPTAQQVLHWQAQMAIALDQPVRVIPQCHKMMGLL